MNDSIEDFLDAISDENLELARIIARNLKHNKTIDGNKGQCDAPIYDMIAWNHFSGFKILIDAGCNLNFKNKCGDTVLMHIIFEQIDSGYMPLTENEAIKYLQYALDNGANPNLMGANIQTALHRAALEGYIKVGKLLLKYGADIDIIEQDDEQYTPLLLSIKHKRFSFAKMLVEEGADIHLRTLLNVNTPLEMFNVQTKDELLIELSNRIKDDA